MICGLIQSHIHTSYAQTGLGLKKVSVKLRVESGLLSVKLNGPSKKRRQVPKLTQSPVKIALFSNDRLLRMRECGDQQCLIKLSTEESYQLLSQYLHTNLPQRTEDADKTDTDDRLMGPLPALRIGILNNQAVAALAVEAQGLGQSLNPEHVFWINRVDFEVPKRLFNVDEVSVIKEPAFVSTPLVDVIESISCTGAECLLNREGVEIFSIDPKRTKLKIKMKLKRSVYIADSSRDGRTINHILSLRRCSIRTANIPLLGGIKDHRLLLAIARGCGAGKYRSIKVKTWPPTRSHIRQEFKFDDPSWRFFELLVQETPSQGNKLEISLIKQKRVEILLGKVNVPLKHTYHPKQLRLKIKRLGEVDFIPTNQSATLTLAYEDPSWLKLLNPKSYLGFYSLQVKKSKARKAGALKRKLRVGRLSKTRLKYSITADPGSSGQVPLLMSYKPKLKKPFHYFNKKPIELATFRTEARYTLRKVNTPIILTQSKKEEAAVHVSCATLDDEIEITPRKVFLIPFESRHSCRVVIKKDRIPKSAGKQHILVTEDREKFKRVVTASHGVGEIVIAIPVKKSKEFDHLEIGVGHNYSSAQYDFAPQQDLGAESRYDVVLGNRSFGVSLSTSLPTGLFRYGFSAEDSSSVALSAGGLGRLLWLWKEGRPFPVGIDFGMLVTGIDGEPHLSIIGGLGVSVPVLNANTPFEASFNLHAWLEYAPTRVGAGQSPWSLLFGPSFAVGKFSTNL